jgi:hypothetical protein
MTMKILVAAGMVGCFVLVASATAAQQQTPVPQPFPRPGTSAPRTTEPPPQPARPAPAQPATRQPAPSQPAARPAVAQPSATSEPAPDPAMLGAPVYPGAQFLGSFDAGKGQRYYLFGTNTSYAEIVAYYRAYLKQGGDEVFDDPPVYIFEMGKYREEAMVYPPGITVKDYAFNGAPGYLVARPGATPPQRFKTIIQIVPVPPAGR